MLDWDFRSVQDILIEMEQEDFRDFVVDGLISSSVTTILGDPYLGKTYLALDAARSLLTGEPFLGRGVEKTYDRVAFLCTDPGGQYDIARRAGRMGIEGGRLLAQPFYTPQSREEWRDAIDVFRQERIGVIVIDNTTDLADDANGPREVKAVTDGLRMWSESGPVIVNIHHKNKVGGYFGSIVWKKWTRVELDLTGNPKTSVRRLKSQANNGESADLGLTFDPTGTPTFAVRSSRNPAEQEAELESRKRNRDKATLDLNKRIADYVDDGHTQRDAASHFGVSVGKVNTAVGAVRGAA
jgi:predicted ATP-dependent serine protease